MLLKTWFSLLYLFSNVEFGFILFSRFANTKDSPKIINVNVEMLFESQNYWVLINASWICVGFTFDLSDIGFLYKDLSDIYSSFLETGIDSFSVNILLVSKASGKHLQDISCGCLKGMS